MTRYATLIALLIALTAGPLDAQSAEDTAADAEAPAAEKTLTPFQALPADSPRRTPLVELVNQCLESTAGIRTFQPTDKPGQFMISFGSGAVVHESGYILTNYHVVGSGRPGEVSIPNLPPRPFRLVAGFASEDLALIKIDVDHPLKPLPLGRSDDLVLGEPVLVIGSPGGLVQSVTEGVVSGLNRATNTEHGFFPWMMQTSAPVNPGNSGGPLINALGQQIGVITSKDRNAENISFAIVIDRVRDMIPQMIAAEQRQGFVLGVDVDCHGKHCTVRSVVDGSPARQAGLQPGDIIQRAAGKKVGSGIDFHLVLVEQQPGDLLELEFRREDETKSASIKLAPLPLDKPVAEEGKVQGLDFAVFRGDWARLPDFGKLSPVSRGYISLPDVQPFKSLGDHFAVHMTGFVKVPAEGLYSFVTISDDGSRLWIADKLVVDNDGLHSALGSSGYVRLKAGMHPITIDFFERTGEEVLQVFYEGPGVDKQQVPAQAFFRQPANDPKPGEANSL